MNVYEEIQRFYESYRGEKTVIGLSCEGRNLFAFFVGKHEHPVGICQYAMHAREWSTALLALHHIGRGVLRGGAWIIPLVNPDGALLSEIGMNSVSEERRELLYKIGGDYRLYKSNIEGVDLNVNFDARWGMGRGNVKRPAPQGFIGPFPHSAPESRALVEFTKKISPDYTISWHTKGEEIYWKFFQTGRRAMRDKRLAKLLSKSTGYPLIETPFSAGGYKDWCVDKLKIPAFTVEAGSDKLTHPLGRESVSGLILRCGEALAEFTEGF